MDYGPIGLIKAFFRTFLEAFDPYPRKYVRKDKNEQDWSLKERKEAYSDPDDDPGKQFWQDLLNQHLDEKEQENEQIARMIIEDYEFRHNDPSDELQEPAENAEASQDSEPEVEASAESDLAESSGFESGSFESGDFESGSFDSEDSGNYDGYIG